MNTSGKGHTEFGTLPLDPLAGEPLTDQIARLANQLYGQSTSLPVAGTTMPTGSSGVTTPVIGAQTPGPHPASFLAPPSRIAPSAFSTGAGGVSTGASLPPTPGVLTAPPLASSPAPRESDLRGGLNTALDALGISTLRLFDSPPHSELPYFLEHAGLPADLPKSASKPALSSRDTELSFQPELVPRSGNVVGVFDPHSVKRDFPILQERVRGKQIVWLDNAATTQKPKSVIDRLTHYYEHENSNIHRAAHTLAARATDAYEAARGKVARFLNAPSPSEIVFVRGATEAINLVAQSWGRRHIGPGDEIVVTWLEHHANIVPWQQLAAEKGAVLRVAPVNDRGEVILEEYERLLGPRTRLVSMTHVSNALGTIVPVKAMTEMAHRHGACVLVDGAQAVSHQRVDVQDIGCEFYAFSGHKVFAPTGIGALFGKRAVLEAMPPWQGGGNMISDVRFERTSYQPPPARFEAGTGNIGDAAGLGAALDYVEQLGLDRIARYEHELLEYGTARLQEIPGLRMIGTAAEKAGVLSFVINGLKTEELGSALDRDGIAVRSGHHCAQPILRRFGLESTVRASLAPYNTRDDLDQLVASLRRLVRQ